MSNEDPTTPGTDAEPRENAQDADSRPDPVHSAPGQSDTTSSKEAPSEDEGADRRKFLARASTIGMVGGLALGYGKFAELAGRYLYPPNSPMALVFVATAQEIEPGGSFDFEAPGGMTIVITRSADSPQNEEPPESDFLALSSTCPHLGCKVHWEAHNDRFFCPCHNGVFDPSGKPLEGPPAEANQHLGKYGLVIDSGMLFIELPTGGVQSPTAGFQPIALLLDRSSRQA